jgi:hypothetical protein
MSVDVCTQHLPWMQIEYAAAFPTHLAALILLRRTIAG